MFVTEVNFKSTDSSIPDEVSFSDLENAAVSPDDNRIDVINVDYSSVDDRSSDKCAPVDDSRSWTMAKVQVGYDVTRKGERSLVVDGFKFTKSRDGTNNRIFWRCSRRECKATAVTVCDRVEHVRAIHAHEPPLAAEFFGSHLGITHHCELQEVRFNTNAANMRPRFRRTNVSTSEVNGEEAARVKEILHSTNISQSEQKPIVLKPENIYSQFKSQNIDIRPAAVMLQNSPQTISSSSVKDQVREFILRNSSQITNCPQKSGVSVAQFLISPGVKSPFLQTTNNSVSSSSNCNSSTVFNFHPTHINALSNSNGSDSTSDISSQHRILTPGLINNVPTMPRNNSPVYNNNTNNRNHHIKSTSDSTSTIDQLKVEQIIQMLVKTGSYNRQRAPSETEWCSPTPGPGLQQFDLGSPPSAAVTIGVPDAGYQTIGTPAPFVHWKKEKLRESENGDQCHGDRKRRHNEYSRLDSQSEPIVNTTTSETDTRQLCSFLNSYRPTITRKLMGVMQKLTSELCPEEAAAQEVFEKCTAIKTCLETLEKLHSLTSF